MTKLKKPKKVRETRRQRLNQAQVNISREADYIIARAVERDTRVVKIGALVLFSTQTGDAWLLDTEDHLALCLVKEGERQHFHISETPMNFSIEWTANYQIEGEKFFVIEQSGRVRMILGYPTQEI